MSLRKAINDKCRDCCYDPADKGTWRQQVESCTITTCPLHPYRPKAASPKKRPNRGQNEQQTTSSDPSHDPFS